MVATFATTPKRHQRHRADTGGSQHTPSPNECRLHTVAARGGIFPGHRVREVFGQDWIIRDRGRSARCSPSAFSLLYSEPIFTKVRDRGIAPTRPVFYMLPCLTVLRLGSD